MVDDDGTAGSGGFDEDVVYPQAGNGTGLDS